MTALNSELLQDSYHFLKSFPEKGYKNGLKSKRGLS